MFPSLYEYHVLGIIHNVRKYKLNEISIISIDNGNTAAILPFAQQEMVHSIMSGVDPALLRHLNENLGQLFYNFSDLINKIIDNYELDIRLDKNSIDAFNEVGKGISEELSSSLEEFQQNEYINPILGMVSMLPKDDLAFMAEALVNITSFKRKITIDAETVGGPIDVAIISKNDGFVWIRRKHYFNPDLNHNYFNRKREACEYVLKDR